MAAGCDKREVAERNAADPPPVWTPLVEVTVGPDAVEDDEEPDESVLEPELPDEEDEEFVDTVALLLLLPLPRELDRMTGASPRLPPRELPSRPAPLRLPRSWGLIRDENLSAPVVPVRRTVRSMLPAWAGLVRIAAAAAFCDVGPALLTKWTPRSMATAARIRKTIRPTHRLPRERFGFGGTSAGTGGATPGGGTNVGAGAPLLIMWEDIGNP